MPNPEATNLAEYSRQIPTDRVDGTRFIVELMRAEPAGATDPGQGCLRFARIVDIEAAALRDLVKACADAAAKDS